MNANKTAFLKLLNDAEAQTYTLSTAQAVVIGREPDCQVVLDSAKHGGVSRRHAMIRYQPENLSFEISDLGSSNGTFVNGQRLFSSQLLKSGDRIQLGSSGVLFSFDDPSLPLTVIHGNNQLVPPLIANNVAGNNVAGNNGSVAPAQPHPATPFGLPPSAPAAISGNRPPIGKIAAITGGVILVILVAGYLGRGNFLSGRSPFSPNNPASPTGEQASESSGSDPSGTSSPSSGTQPLSDPDGLFQVELPAGYQTESRADGINLASADGSFQGAITAVRAPQEFTPEELIQGFTNQQNNNSNLENFTIQNSEAIEGGVRIDWVARLTSVNSNLDAVTHFLQQGDVVVEVDLFSVDRPFSQQDAEEANAILGSLRINP